MYSFSSLNPASLFVYQISCPTREHFYSSSAPHFLPLNFSICSRQKVFTPSLTLLFLSCYTYNTSANQVDYSLIYIRNISTHHSLPLMLQPLVQAIIFPPDHGPSCQNALLYPCYLIIYSQQILRVILFNVRQIVVQNQHTNNPIRNH